MSEQQKFELKTWADAEVTHAPGPDNLEVEPEQDNEDNDDAAAEAEFEEKS